MAEISKSWTEAIQNLLIVNGVDQMWANMIAAQIVKDIGDSMKKEGRIEQLQAQLDDHSPHSYTNCSILDDIIEDYERLSGKRYTA